MRRQGMCYVQSLAQKQSNLVIANFTGPFELFNIIFYISENLGLTQLSFCAFGIFRQKKIGVSMLVKSTTGFPTSTMIHDQH